MEVSIIGLPKSGKTTIFNALTKGEAKTTAYSTSNITINLGTSRVPEPRLQTLSRIFQPKKITQAEIKYVDMAGIGRASGRSDGISGQLLSHLSNADALLQVVRAFEDATVPHINGSINSKRDLMTMHLELTFSDLVIIERRLQRIETSLKGSGASERQMLLKEQHLLNRVKTSLENDIPIWRQGLSVEEIKNLSNYQFLTAKPVLVILNIGEAQLAQTASLEAEVRSACPYPQFDVMPLCGKLEMELAQLSDTEAEEFRKELGLAEPVVDRIIKTSYKLLNLISFFTTVSAELRAWTIPEGTITVKAAGKIHSDMERGFIRAEVIGYDDLNKCGNMAEARKQGLLRLEGKSYVIQDGDIVTFLFNI